MNSGRAVFEAPRPKFRPAIMAHFSSITVSLPLRHQYCRESSVHWQTAPRSSGVMRALR